MFIRKIIQYPTSITGDINLKVSHTCHNFLFLKFSSQNICILIIYTDVNILIPNRYKDLSNLKIYIRYLISIEIFLKMLMN